MRRLKILQLDKSGSWGFPSFFLLFLKHLRKQDYQCAYEFHHLRDITREFGQVWDSAVLATFTPLLLIKGENIILEHSPETALLPFNLLVFGPAHSIHQFIAFINASSMCHSPCIPGDTKWKKARSLPSVNQDNDNKIKILWHPLLI